jgi:hypothetical protein
MLKAAGVLATEETPLTADLPGASRKVTVAGMLKAAGVLATEETPLTADLYQEHHRKVSVAGMLEAAGLLATN